MNTIVKITFEFYGFFQSLSLTLLFLSCITNVYGQSNASTGLSDMKEIPNSNGRFFLCQNPDTFSLIYDNRKKEAIPAIFNGQRRKYESIVYLGERGKEPVFHDLGCEMFGLNGFFAEVDAEGMGLHLDVKDNTLSFTDDNMGDYKIRLQDIPNANRMYSDLDYYHDELHFKGLPKGEESEENDDGGISFFVCVPKLTGLDRIKQHVLYWIADCYAASKGIDRIGNMSTITDEKKLVEAIKQHFFHNQVKDCLKHSELYHDIENHNETYRAYLMYCTKEYASFLIEYWIRGEIKCWYAATFDIERNSRLTLSDIVDTEGKSKIVDYLSYYYNPLGIKDYGMPVIMSKYGLQFYIGEREPSFEAVNEIMLADSPSKLELLEEMTRPFVPYDSIAPWLKIHISSDGKTLAEDVKYFFAPINDEGNRVIRVGDNIPVYNLSDTLSAEDIKIEESINDGYTRNNVKRLKEKNPRKAIEIYPRLLEEYKTTLAESDMRNDYFHSYLLLAEQQFLAGNYAVADSLCRSVLMKMPIDTKRILTTNYFPYVVSNRLCGLESPTYSDSLSVFDYSTKDGLNVYIDATILLSRIRQKQKDMSSVSSYTPRAYKLLMSYLSENIHNMSKEMRNTLWNHYRDWLLSDLLVCAIQLKDQNLLKSAYEAQLYGKGLLLNSEVAIIKHIVNSEDELAKKRLAEYRKTQEAIERARRMGRKKSMKDLEEELMDLSYLLMENIYYSNYLEMQNVTMGQVANRLRLGEVAVEFVDVREQKDTVVYALVLQYGDTIPVVSRICSYAELRKCKMDDITNGNLYHLVWKPLEKELLSKNTVYFSPSSSLYTQAIESAIEPNSGLRMNERFKTYRLSSTREIVIARDPVFKHQNVKNTAALLIGGLDYNAQIYTQPKSNMNEVKHASLFRGAIQQEEVYPLPSTKKEVEIIKPLLHDAQMVDSVITLDGDKGTETAFRLCSKFPLRMLHIATHGFYLSDKDFMKLDESHYISKLGKDYRDIEEKGMIRSGLFFAGVNHVLTDNRSNLDDDDDGVMTSMEISTMDLNSIDLAVLSACQTASGEIASDGVMGLQRGFKKAGVKSILMSLWPVDDEATCLFMTYFYQYLAVSHDKQIAFRSAQKSLKDSREFASPLYWAAFVLLDAII